MGPRALEPKAPAWQAHRLTALARRPSVVVDRQEHARLPMSLARISFALLDRLAVLGFDTLAVASCRRAGAVMVGEPAAVDGRRKV